MIPKTLATVFSLFLFATTLLPQPEQLIAQDTRNSSSLMKQFIGTWKGICADGEEFINLKFGPSENDASGTVSIANMGGADGQCATVNDPPTDEHAMKLHDIQLHGKTLAFKGSGQTAFEMSIVSDDEATLKFLGTPVENRPWKLKRVK